MLEMQQNVNLVAYGIPSHIECSLILDFRSKIVCLRTFEEHPRNKHHILAVARLAPEIRCLHVDGLNTIMIPWDHAFFHIITERIGLRWWLRSSSNWPLSSCPGLILLAPSLRLSRSFPFSITLRELHRDSCIDNQDSVGHTPELLVEVKTG
jgi:hypothetical protein